MATVDKLRHEVSPVLCPATQAVYKDNGRSGAACVVVNAVTVDADKFARDSVKSEFYLDHSKEQLNRAQAGIKTETNCKRDNDQQRSLQDGPKRISGAGWLPIRARWGHSDKLVRIVHCFVRRVAKLARKLRMTRIVSRPDLVQGQGGDHAERFQ